MRYPIRTTGRRPRRGIVLIAVLLVVALLALAAYRFSDLMQAEYQAADSYTRTAQARELANGGIDYVIGALTTDPTGQGILNGNQYDNPTMFQSILVHNDDVARKRGRFSILSPLDADTALAGGSSDQPYRFGVTDEAGKININALFKLDSSGMILYNVLMQLPNMTDAIANSIIYWIDPNAVQRSSGATDEYYSSLNPPYHAKNAPLDSLEELLYVQGVTPQLLFGNDTKHNGMPDPDADDGTGTLDQGWFPYLTMYSRELNVDSQGNPRIWVNDPNLQSLQTDLATVPNLPDAMAAFILAYRLYGGTSGTGGAGGAGATGAGMAAAGTTGAGATGTTMNISLGGGTISTTIRVVAASTPTAKISNQPLSSSMLPDLSQLTKQPTSISSLYQLINAQVTVPGDGQTTPDLTYMSPMTDSGSIQQYLPIILDELTTTQASNLPARINVNTAPSVVLSALAPNGTTPLLDPGTVQMILTTRPAFSSTNPPDPSFLTPAWLITQAGLSPTTVQSLDKYITARSQVYRIQSVGHFDAGGPTARVEAVIDLNGGRPRIVYYRDLTILGKGFDLPKSP